MVGRGKWQVNARVGFTRPLRFAFSKLASGYWGVVGRGNLCSGRNGKPYALLPYRQQGRRKRRRNRRRECNGRKQSDRLRSIRRQRRGIFVGDGCSVMLEDSAGSGRGVYIVAAVMNMKGGEIKNNTAKNGGGVYVDDAGATLTMSGGTISANKAEKDSTDSRDGGVYIYKAAFTLKAGTVSNNTADRDGGGVKLVGGTFTMEGGVIEGNTITGTTTASGAGRAGGVKIVAATMNMKGGEIKNNTAKNGGGGVSLGLSGADNAVLNMSGGTISGNTLTNPAGTGKGVEFFTGSTTHSGTTYYTIMKMSGSAKVDTNNDVYVNDSRMITVDGALTGTAPAARLTPKTYAAGRQVLDGSAVGSVYNKFEVTPQSTPPTTWSVGSDGKLKTP